MKTRIEKFYDYIEARGWKCKIISTGHLSELRETILNYYNQGFLDKALFRDQLSFFSFNPPPDIPDVRSIIIVAVPTPQMQIFCYWQGKRIPVVIPPTYVSYTKRTENIQGILASWHQDEGYHLAPAKLPLKTIAVRSGLAHYGRNNICYVEEMGSFLQLVGVFSDLPSNGDSWQEPKMLGRCENCIACLRKCPTKAINNDCFQNKKPGIKRRL